MSDAMVSRPANLPLIVPLGDQALLVRFALVLSDAANLAALEFAARFGGRGLAGVREVVPSLVSVLVTYDPNQISFGALAGEVRLALGDTGSRLGGQAREWTIPVRFGGAEGPDLDAVAASVGLSSAEFVARHNATILRVLATGFAPGFVYCGFHPAELIIPRRTEVRAAVPAGSILFAAGQTAIAATDIPTGWHMIGRTDFRNFDPQAKSPTQLAAGDLLRFEAVS